MNKGRLTRNVAANWTLFFTYVAIGFVLSPIVVTRLGSIQYGLWTLIVSLTGYYGFLDMGIQAGVGHYVSRYLATGDERKLNRTVNTAFTIMLAIGVVIVAVSFGLAQAFPSFFRVQQADIPSIKTALIIIGFSVACKFPFGVFQAMLVSSQRFDIVSGVSIVSRVGGAVLMVWALGQGHGLVALSAITAAQQITEGIFMVIMALRVVPSARLRFFTFDREVVREVWGYGAYNFLGNLCAQFSASMAPFVIGRMVDPVAVTHYSVGSNLIPYMTSVITSVSTPLLQVVIPLDVKGKDDEIRKLFLRGSRYLGILVFLIGLNLVLIGPAFLSTWMGPQFLSKDPPGSSGTVLIILAATQVIWCFSAIATQILYGRRKQKIYTAIIFADSLAKFALCIPLVNMFGMPGAAWAMLIPTAFTLGVAVPVVVGRLVGVPFLEYLTTALLPNLLVASLVYAACALALQRLPVEGWAGLFLAGTAISALHLSVSAMTVLEKPVREELRVAAARRIAGLMRNFSKEKA